MGQKQSSDYTVLGPLGTGGFGTVVKAREKKTGKVVALKQVVIPRFSKKTRKATMQVGKGLYRRPVGPSAARLATACNSTIGSFYTGGPGASQAESQKPDQGPLLL